MSDQEETFVDTAQYLLDHHMENRMNYLRRKIKDRMIIDPEQLTIEDLKQPQSTQTNIKTKEQRMASLLELNVMDTPDLEVQKEGEYKIRIMRAAVAHSKESQSLGLKIVFELPEAPNAKPVMHWIGLEAKPDATVKEKQDAARRIKDFLLAFGFEQNPLNEAAAAQTSSEDEKGTVIEDWQHAEGYALLGIQPAQGQYGESNRINRFVISR